ncbi:hypothetical protein B5807_02363 [Epicoccum nigrum]|uniref:YjgF-like protein n=1 Tax=Epicoccum nigrum TaxID=105696 RepID=A0A1Y2M885_EPING|nr:hypothetical protein B5807_02363 [Epicoccum nigrum]
MPLQPLSAYATCPSAGRTNSPASRPSLCRQPPPPHKLPPPRSHHNPTSLPSLNPPLRKLTHLTQSQAIIAGPNVFVSGQIPADKTGALIDGSITDKTTQCCENILAILKEANTPVEKIVKVNVFLDDMAHFAEMNGVFEKYFAHKPARSCVAVKQLPKGVPVEIECIAYNG